MTHIFAMVAIFGLSFQSKDLILWNAQIQGEMGEIHIFHLKESSQEAIKCI